MSLRNKLLAAFIAIAFFVMVVFGIIAYNIAIDAATGSEAGIFETLGVRLALTGAIVVWIAVWGALILSTIIARRLDAKNAELLYQALHDALTGLPNRTLFFDRLEQAIRVGRRENKPFALFFMDLDRFRDINDALGHQNGDLLLQQVGPRLKGTLRESDTVARLGGDEFAVLLGGVGAEEAIPCVNKGLKALEKPFYISGMALAVESSIGIAIYPDHGEDAETLLRRADLAMYQAKRRSSGCVLYAPDLDPDCTHRLKLMGELRHAMENDELVLYYEPKVNLQSFHTSGVEALLRWQHPEHGLTPPGEFIPLAEQCGLIKPLARWVLNTALRQCHAWHQMGLRLNVAVNISARNLQDPKLPDHVAELLETWGMEPRRLELEITESAMMAEPSRAMSILKRLDGMGVRLAIDDFGTGFSSLAYFKRLPVCTLKIDKSFVMDMIRDEHDGVIVRSTIDLAHNMGCKVTAEGVENKEILDLLATLGCDMAQGTYVSRPLPAEELARWLRESRWGVDEQDGAAALVTQGGR